MYTTTKQTQAGLWLQNPVLALDVSILKKMVNTEPEQDRPCSLYWNHRNLVEKLIGLMSEFITPLTHFCQKNALIINVIGISGSCVRH